MALEQCGIGKTFFFSCIYTELNNIACCETFYRNFSLRNVFRGKKRTFSFDHIMEDADKVSAMV